MKNNVLYIKLCFMLFIFISVSCTGDNECDENDLQFSFPIKVKLTSSAGDNLFDDANFNSSLLKITDAIDSNTETTYSQIVENGETLITFQAFGMDGVNFEYDAVDKFYFGFHDIISQSDDCVVKMTQYMALEVNGDVFCDCSVDDVLVVTLDL